MKVILKEDVRNIGTMGQIIDVTDGFARNYLVPKGLAVEANTKNIKALEHQKNVIREKARKIKKKAEDIAGDLSGRTVTIKAKSGEEGKLFGSVTAMDIVEKLKEQGLDVDKKKVVLEEPIKRLGTYQVKIKIHSEVSGQITVEVVEEQEETAP
jgi:large subunit ribosomal protein L9